SVARRQPAFSRLLRGGSVLRARASAGQSVYQYSTVSFAMQYSIMLLMSYSPRARERRAVFSYGRSRLVLQGRDRLVTTGPGRGEVLRCAPCPCTVWPCGSRSGVGARGYALHPEGWSGDGGTVG